MAEKIIILTIVFVGVLVHDFRKLRQKPKKDVICYCLLMAFAAYLGVDYLLDVNLPDLDEFLDWTVAKPGIWMFDYLDVGP